MAKTRNWIPNDKVLNDGMAKARKIIDNAIIESLSELAERSIKHVLTITRGYNHKTFNLRDSYGYGIYNDGALVKMWLNNPSATKPDSAGGSGANEGASFLRRFTPEGAKWSLVVVAGEFYAANVETMAKLDVLSGAYQYSEQNFLQDFKKI